MTTPAAEATQYHTEALFDYTDTTYCECEHCHGHPKVKRDQREKLILSADSEEAARRIVINGIKRRYLEGLKIKAVAVIPMEEYKGDSLIDEELDKLSRWQEAVTTQ